MASAENLQEQTVPSKEEIIQFFQEQIDVKKVQAELQELNTKLAVLRAEELKALSFIAQMTAPKSNGAGEESPYAGGVPHTLTEEDFKHNPELKDQGFKVGDQVMVSIGSDDDVDKEEPQAPAPKQRSLKTK